MWICPLAVNANAMQCWWLWLPAVRLPVRPSTVQVDNRCVRRPRFQVGFVDSLLGTDYNQTTISRDQETSSTPSAASMLWHRFSAFWLSPFGRVFLGLSQGKALPVCSCALPCGTCDCRPFFGNAPAQLCLPCGVILWSANLP